MAQNPLWNLFHHSTLPIQVSPPSQYDQQIKSPFVMTKVALFLALSDPDGFIMPKVSN